ncbi:hypothetical protein C8D89_1261, partial [Actinomycetospora cinnamomea]
MRRGSTMWVMPARVRMTNRPGVGCRICQPAT